MSKIGRIPIDITEEVSVSLSNGKVTVSGPKGTLSYDLAQGIEVKIAEGKVVVSKKSGSKELEAVFGLTRALIANMIKGVKDGFEKKLELSGVGYRAQLQGDDLVLSVGFSHPVMIKAMEGIKFQVSENVITVSGIDKRLVGDVAAKIREIRKPEPYKGKGIKYQGERIRRKTGKAAKTLGVK